MVRLAKGFVSMETTKREKFTDYEGFCQKFKTKKTTDDCYTPPAVYNAVLDWVRRRFCLGDAPIVRPFYPGGDYEATDYPEGCVVVDNPPFSIYTAILRFYQARGIRFFLFAPQLTLASNDTDTAYYICNSGVVYDNGAVVNTSFSTNLDTENRFVICPDLKAAVEAAIEKGQGKKSVRKVSFPANITSSARLGTLANAGVPLAIRKEECQLIRHCGNYDIFGCGYVLSDTAANRVLEAQRVQEAKIVTMDMGPDELEILRRLNARMDMA